MFDNNDIEKNYNKFKEFAEWFAGVTGEIRGIQKHYKLNNQTNQLNNSANTYTKNEDTIVFDFIKKEYVTSDAANCSISRETSPLTKFSTAPHNTQNNLNLDNLITEKQINFKGGNDMPRPPKYGQGSIKTRTRLNENGTTYEWYQIRWYDEYGIRHTATAKTLDAADKILKQNNNRSLRNKLCKYIKTFGISFQEWYETFKKPKIQLKDDKHFMKLICEIPKAITSKLVTQVTDTELQAHLNNVPNARNRHDLKQLICTFLKRLFIKGIIKVDIASLLVAPKPKAGKRNILPRELEQDFLELVKPNYRNHALVGIYTGCRYSEIMRINESHINRIKKRIKILGTKGAKIQGYEVREREIPLLPGIEHIKFPLPRISYSRYADNIRDICEKIGIKITAHDFKHTFATRCREASVDLKTYSGWLDHASVDITADLYSNHMTDELFEKEAAKLRKSTPISTPICAEKYDSDTENKK